MCKHPEDIAANIDPKHSDTDGANTLPSPPHGAALAALDLNESDYLTHVQETVGEWASSEDESAFSNL